MYFFRLLAMSVICCAAFTLTSCGEKKGGSAPPAPQGKIDRAFTLTSQQIRIPQRYLMAVGYLESRLNPLAGYANYGNKLVGGNIMSSAFGVDIEELGLTEEHEQLDLALQIEAYGEWVYKKLQSDQVYSRLNPSPRTTDEKFEWLWSLAHIHRFPGTSTSLIVKQIFVRELIQILNDGFDWQSPETGELLSLSPENPKIEIFDLSPNYQTDIELPSPVRSTGGMFGVSAYNLPTVNIEPKDNIPSHIKIVHCPLNLSACLELQKNSPQSGEVLLGAHYVIPSFKIKNGISEVMQIAKHYETVYLTDENGNAKPVSDAIVIMLTGYSGRNVNSVYRVIEPGWFSSQQLQLMGSLVRQLCEYMPENFDNKETQYNIPSERECNDINDINHGVRFQFPNPNKIIWGDIADFYSETQHDIFYSQITSTKKLEGAATITLPGDRKIFQKNDPITFNVNFGKHIKTIEVEKLVRCAGTNQLRWRRLAYSDVRNTNTKQFIVELPDSGPDGNGTHFLRTRVYNAGLGIGLEGFDFVKLHIKNFERETTLEYCN